MVELDSTRIPDFDNPEILPQDNYFLNGLKYEVRKMRQHSSPNFELDKAKTTLNKTFLESESMDNLSSLEQRMQFQIRYGKLTTGELANTSIENLNYSEFQNEIARREFRIKELEFLIVQLVEVYCSDLSNKKVFESVQKQTAIMNSIHPGEENFEKVILLDIQGKQKISP
jgi:hypothetical protein